MSCWTSPQAPDTSCSGTISRASEWICGILLGEVPHQDRPRPSRRGSVFLEAPGSLQIAWDRALPSAAPAFATVFLHDELDREPIGIAVGVHAQARERTNGGLRVPDLELGLAVSERSTGIGGRDPHHALVSLPERRGLFTGGVVASVAGLRAKLPVRLLDLPAPPRAFPVLLRIVLGAVRRNERRSLGHRGRSLQHREGVHARVAIA